MYLYITDTRSSGVETFGAPIWWNQLRIVHALLYTWFIVDVMTNKPHPFVPLVIDWWIGLMAFTIHHMRM
jgi:hypothetical protein